ncbi:transcription factor [Striga asiatica]|uniref:Transcription factor n=1 Tax=Striga asiatica TaxID=4170 RepID=A0A5A7Q631_STRAF|nr:transcription factor [Striga asiatica]
MCRNKDACAYELGELDESLFLYLDGQDQSIQDQSQNLGTMRPHTLNIFPSEPMHVEPSSKANAGFVSPSGSNGQSEPSREGNRKGPASSSEQGPKATDSKAYVQQLESSRMRLTQLEQEIQRATSQGYYQGVAGDQGATFAMGNITSDAALFEIEYARWLEEHHHLMAELRRAVQANLPENELRIFVDRLLDHYEHVMNLKSMIAKSDVFHLFSGMWKTPVERCFMWMGGFRPSELIKIISREIEPIIEQQMVGIYNLQQSTREAEEALSQGLQALKQSLTQTIVSGSLNSIIPSNTNDRMALALNKLSTLEDFAQQGDNLRQQTLHRLNEILTTRQAARCFLAIGEYFHRLQALSSLWLARPRPG